MIGKEPTVVFNGISEVIRATIPVLILFGFIHWTDQQIAGVILLVGVLVGFLTTLFTRSQTVPTEKANAQIATAITMPATATVEDVVAKEERQSK